MIINLKNNLKKIYLVREVVRAYRSYFGQPYWLDKITKNFQNKIKAGSNKKILIATGGGSYLSGVAIESMLGSALTLRGIEAHILLCDEILPACLQSNIDFDRDEKKFAKNGPSVLFCKSCFMPSAKMYQSLGFIVHRISDMIQAEDRVHIRRILDSLPLNKIREYKFEGIPVGEHSYAGALRFYAKAELNDAYSEQILRRYLEASIISVISIKRLCKKYNFFRSLLHHGIYVPQGVFAEALMNLNIPIVTWHVAYRKETFLFSHGGTYHRTLMTEPLSTWENINWNIDLEKKISNYLNSRWYGSNDWIHFHRNTIFDKNEIYSKIGVNKEKPYILALTNVMWDAQLHYPNNAFANMLDWINHTIRWFIDHPHLQLILRVHPAELTGTLPSRQKVTDEIRKSFSTLPKNIFIIGPDNPISTYILADDCNAAIIYGTKSGVELAAQGIPVIVTGEAWIRNKGLTIDVGNPVEYNEVLDKLPFQNKLDYKTLERAKKYAYHFFFRRMIPLPFVKLDKSGQRPFEFKINSIDDFAEGKYKGLDVICDGIINGSSFIYPDEN